MTQRRPAPRIIPPGYHSTRRCAARSWPSAPHESNGLSERSESKAWLPGHLAVALATILWFLAPSYAGAHGILQGSSPPANTVLPSSPREVVLALSEPVDPAYSTATVRDQRGTDYARVVRVGPDGRRLVVTVRTLPEGLYTVRWHVLSAVDGHTTAGAFLFSVGRAITAAVPPTSAGPDLRVVIARWVTLVAALLLAGTVMFEALVFRWTLARSTDPRALVDAGRLLIRRMTIVAALVYLAASGAEFLFQAAVLLDRGVGEVARPAVLGPLVVNTRGGWSLLLRTSMALVALIPASSWGRIARFAAFVWLVVVTGVIAVLGGPPALGSAHVTVIVLVGTVYALAAVLAAVILPRIPDVRIPEGRWVPMAAVVVLLAGFTLISHAAASGPVAFVADWLHLLGAAIWVGGLPALVFLLRRIPLPMRNIAARTMVPRVSGLALAGLLTMAATGLYSAWLHVPSLRALVTTAYGKELLLKVVIVAIVVGLGALNRFAFRPGIEAGTDQGGALRAFGRSASVEVFLGAAILLVVAVLTITPPASVVTSAGPRPGVRLVGLTARYQVQARVIRQQGGWTEIEVTVTDPSGQKAVAGAHVTLRIESLELDLGGSIEMMPAGPGRFTAAGDYLREDGYWSVSVAVRDEAGNAEEIIFPQVVGGAARTPDPLAVEFLSRLRGRLARVRTWREEEQITDGLGHVAVTRFEAARPDRLRYVTRSGSETIIIGASRYSREQGGTWVKDALPQPISLGEPYADYMNGAAEVRFGREVPCGAEPCRIVLWRLPAARASFAIWIGRQTGTVHRLMMVAPQHYMTSYLYDLNAQVPITPP